MDFEVKENVSMSPMPGGREFRRRGMVRLMMIRVLDWVCLCEGVQSGKEG